MQREVSGFIKKHRYQWFCRISDITESRKLVIEGAWREMPGSMALQLATLQGPRPVAPMKSIRHLNRGDPRSPPRWAGLDQTIFTDRRRLVSSGQVMLDREVVFVHEGPANRKRPVQKRPMNCRPARASRAADGSRCTGRSGSWKPPFTLTSRLRLWNFNHPSLPRA
jgi:hypothetical protein